MGRGVVLLFFVAGLVESNRTPFDVPEGESEIVAGHMTEYSGFKYATFFSRSTSACSRSAASP
jgi:NADH:ubiquinone oxidoreductase subunit H